MPLKRILVPVDFSGDSLHALTYARDLVAPFGSEIVLLHVIEPIYYAAPADLYMTSPNLAVLLNEQERMATQQLGRLAADLQRKGARVRTLLKSGSAAHLIIETAARLGANLIVMATHGRTGLSHMFMGSVAEKVVRGAACPVLTVRRGVLKKRRQTRGASARARQRSSGHR